jgi:hypothetical protein
VKRPRMRHDPCMSERHLADRVVDALGRRQLDRVEQLQVLAAELRLEPWIIERCALQDLRLEVVCRPWMMDRWDRETIDDLGRRHYQLRGSVDEPVTFIRMRG